ncbi:MAG TPA: fumarylacetoacetate hydrolase family protein, partial [Ktedonobacterales bacterium]
MRLVTIRETLGEHAGVERGGKVFSLARTQFGRGWRMLDILAEGPSALPMIRAAMESADEAAWTPLAEVTLLAPIPRPAKNIFCIGRNYAEHAAESLRAIGQEVKLPPAPNVFTKAPTSVIGPEAAIPFDPELSAQMDWEAELGVVIGVAGRHIPEADALAHVFGYTIINDVSARDVQHRPGMQWFLGKSFDGSCPMGPAIVTADEISDPQRLAISLTVNGITKQQDTTASMLFSVAAIIADLSRYLTLEPGDIIATGTPAGVGFGRTPPEFLVPGDVVEASIEGIGTL